MYFIVKIIILFQIYAGIDKCKAYVLQTTQKLDNSVSNDFPLTEIGVTDPSIYIGNMIQPNEIKEPSSLTEIVNYVGADKLSNKAVMPEGSPLALTYTELTKLLAFWQLANEQNFYEMHRGQTEGFAITVNNNNN